MVIHSSPVVADALGAQLVELAAAPRIETTYSWADFARTWDFLPIWAVVDAYLDDHVPLALKVRSLVHQRSGVIVLGTAYGAASRSRARSEGASDWIEPTVGLRETAQRIAAAAARRPSRDRQAPPAADGVRLTDRELQLASLHASRRGSTPSAIGRTLGLSAHTVKSHIASARRKYLAAGRPAPTREQLAAELIADGYLTADADWERQARW